VHGPAVLLAEEAAAGRRCCGALDLLNELVCSRGTGGYDKKNQSRDVEPADNRMLKADCHHRNRNGGPMIINLLATWTPALLIAFLGVLKLTGNPRVAEEMSKLGVGRYLRLLGVMEIAFAALFVVPATMKLGFILASCYFAGAIATELSHEVLKVNPFIPIVLLWIGAFIRDRSIFF
jgi:DoxX-like family